MNISTNLLFSNDEQQVDFQDTPNKEGLYTPQYLVIHFTAVTTAKSSINWFLNKDAKASAHLLIDRDGTITQFAPFNVITWHAGKSRWNGLVGLNKFSIGIELVNGGRLVKTGNAWICPVDRKPVPGSEVVIARHKNENTRSGWHVYTKVQMQAAIEVGALLVAAYNLKDVVGHDDIAPFRKCDPGPAFPMGSYRSRVMGRNDDTLDDYVINTDGVNIRSGAGTQFGTITDPLPKNTKVQLLKRDGNWSFVEVLDTVHGFNDLEGWVSTKFLEKA